MAPRRTASSPANSRHSLSASEARAIAIRAQGLALTSDRPRSADDVLHRLGAVQLDTISVLARSHELVAYARLGAIGRAAVEDAYWGEPARAFEYIAHANCVLPVESWPYFAFRRNRLGRRARHEVSKRVVEEVRARLREGAITVSDLGGARQGRGGWWNWSEAKFAIEVMFLRGEVLCATRRNWKRVYDLPERVLPADVLGAEPSDEDCYRYLVQTAIRARGIGTRRDVAGYFQLLTAWRSPGIDRGTLMDTALEDAGLEVVEVEGWREPAYVDPALLRARAPARHRITLLSPFDSLVWADAPPPGAAPREHTRRLFGYEFPFEPYKPKAAREHGYFVMPLLAGGRIAGHVDPAREGRTLIARSVLLHDEAAVEEMASALREAAEWVGCEAVRVERVQPRPWGEALRRALA